MNKKILIVDDEKAIVDILNHNLRKEGYNTLQAYDGEEALKVFHSAPIGHHRKKASSAASMLR